MTRLLGTLLGGLLLTACGIATTPSAAPLPEPNGPRTGLSAEITGVRLAGADRLVLTLVTDYDDDQCATRPRAAVVRERGTVFLTPTFDSIPSGHPTCLDMPTDAFSVRVPHLLRTDLVAAGLAGTWKPGPRGTYVRCSEGLGCHPPKDRCDPIWTSSLTIGVELPPERRIDELACDKGWLVADVDAVATGCQSVDGSVPPAGCGGSGVHTRWFARLDDDKWEVVASGASAGCADVEMIDDFPRRLCEALPAR